MNSKFELGLMTGFIYVGILLGALFLGFIMMFSLGSILTGLSPALPLVIIVLLGLVAATIVAYRRLMSSDVANPMLVTAIGVVGSVIIPLIGAIPAFSLAAKMLGNRYQKFD